MSMGKIEEAKKVLKLYAGLSDAKIDLDSVALVVDEGDNIKKTDDATIMTRVRT